MLHRFKTAGLYAAAAMALAAAAAPAALADADPAPSFSRCPVANASVVSCIVVQSTDGSMQIRNTTVPIGNTIRLDAGLAQDATGQITLVAPTTGSALTAQPVEVPGGLLGIPLPLGFDTVKATPKQVGTAKIDSATGDITLPIKIKLDNPLLGSGCQIGSSWFPITLRLTTGTTNPPAPNTPISGQMGTFQAPDAITGEFQGNVRVDNAFSVPIAVDCGYFTGLLVTTLVNVKIGLPSPSGHNTMRQVDNMFIRSAADVRAGA